MAKGQKKYTEEFRNTIIELYNSGKSLQAVRNAVKSQRPSGPVIL